MFWSGFLIGIAVGFILCDIAFTHRSNLADTAEALALKSTQKLIAVESRALKLAGDTLSGI